MDCVCSRVRREKRIGGEGTMKRSPLLVVGRPAAKRPVPPPAAARRTWPTTPCLISRPSSVFVANFEDGHIAEDAHINTKMVIKLP
jgi:hypothetical protein